MKILHLLSQRPDSTGSGIYLQAMLREGAKQGYRNFLIAGLPEGEAPQLAGLRPENTRFVRFRGGDLSCTWKRFLAKKGYLRVPWLVLVIATFPHWKDAIKFQMEDAMSSLGKGRRDVR